MQSVKQPISPQALKPLIGLGCIVLCLASITSSAKADSVIDQIHSKPRFARILERHPLATWFRAEDPENSDTITMQSLVASSSLIAIVRGRGTIKRIRHGILTTEYRTLTVESVINNVLASHLRVVAGSEIVVADLVMSDGHELLDDLAIAPGERALVFLQRLPKLQQVNGVQFPLYRFSAPYVSKWNVGADGVLTAMSVRLTNLKQHLDGTYMNAFVGHVSSVDNVYERALNEQGIRSPAQRRTLTARLISDPWGLERSFAVRDALRSGVIFHKG